ncbi:3-keto-5-aminohexanoate cleavage protein [candidate division KSB1 bacterium]|nr:3-keto-5-aminohexanoate cleavage protein [candidate division KSB1 bacterium]
MNQKNIIINFTPTGMIPTKEMTPHVPIQPEKIVEDVLRANEIGITMVHIHARDRKTGRPSFETDVYAQIIDGIRKGAPDLIICVSLSGRDFKEYEKRAEPLKLEGNLKPDMGSLTLSSLNFNKQASMNEPYIILALAENLRDSLIKPELEVFDSGMINYAHYLIGKGLITPPYYFNLILGNIACAQADPLHAGVMIRDMPDNSLWSIGGIGDFQLPMNAMSIALGGGVRVGLEDNIWFDRKRTRLATNSDLIRRIHKIAVANERNIMSSAELRKILNLESGHGKYGMKSEA